MPKKSVVTIGQFPSYDDAVISASFRALVDGRGLDKVVVAAQCGMTRDQMYDRVRGDAAWKASDVAAVARYFNIRIGDLYDGLGGRVGPPGGPLAQSEELRTFNPLSGIGEMAKVLPFKPRPVPQDLSLVVGS